MGDSVITNGVVAVDSMSMAPIGVIYYICILAIAIFLLAMNWIIFTKAGEKGWKVLIPCYNAYIFYKITWAKGWMFLLTFIPIVGSIVAIISMFKLAKVFGHGAGFGLGLLFIPVIFYPILALGKSEYVGCTK